MRMQNCGVGAVGRFSRPIIVLNSVKGVVCKVGAFIDLLQPVFNVLPEVRAPLRAPGLREKLGWTAAALVIFFILGQIYPIGVDQAALVSFERIEILLGSKIGTLITAGFQ